MSVDRTGQTLESPWTESTRAQWQRLREHAFEDAQAPLDFAAKLACEQGWSRDQALAAIEEYRRYCFLASVEAGMVVPSVAVDEVWHLHLTYSEDYWLRFCPAALGFAFHHRPGGLVRGDSAQYRRGYADTLAHYERWFGAPPERWWPGTAERFRAPARFRRVDTEQVWLVRKPVWPRRPTAIAAGVAATVTALMASSFAEAASLNPLDWSGPKFLLLFMVLMIISLSFALAQRRQVGVARASSVSGLDPSAVALLAGGESRVVERVVGELLARNAAQFDARSAHLQIKHVPDGLDATADAITRELQRDGNLGTLATRSAGAMAPLRRGLEQRGLMWDRDAAAAFARRSAVAPLLVLGLGVAKIAIGIARDRPVALLVVLCVLLAIATLVLWFKRPGQTQAGRDALAALRQQHARAVRAPRDHEWPIALALVGSSVLAGTAYAAFHDYRQPASTSSSSDSSSSSSSDSGSSDSGSSDSGGGDSGGGCGGCGGGGGD
ncbi:MAG: TIGR04222 domain-containing membrane protein [Rhodanobacteraceae bacterium]|nr:TIGR04222 domain-containing membrane protein [Rhodanobacteraceae bacterium]